MQGKQVQAVSITFGFSVVVRTQDKS